MLREATAALLFFGALVGRADLEQAGTSALAELAARGYAAIGDAAPVRVYPLADGADAEAGQAARWRPGIVSLRPEPVGGEPATVYLRHELMHEASWRTCGGRLRLWAEEAAAIAFSGERLVLRDVSDEALEHLRTAARLDALDAASYRTLEALVARHGWPVAPCAESTAIAALVRPLAAEEGALASIVVSVASGRVLEASGDVTVAAPPGSVLKLPFAAALDAADPERLGEELARSDTDALLARRPAFRRDRFVRLLAPVAGTRVRLPPALDGERAWRALLGERTADGGYAVEASLAELALVVRAALLARPAAFAGLARNGTLAGSTLEHVAARAQEDLRGLRALAKTGTISNARGDPLGGHLVLAWPAERPRYVAVLRKPGVRGAAVLAAAHERLERWRTAFPPAGGDVRVRLFTPLDARAVRQDDPCPGLDVGDDGSTHTTTCGELRFTTDAPGARPERVVRGLVERRDDRVVLVTDPESYADGVLDAEAADLAGAARTALRAVIVWNGVHGAGRHPDERALCDTTHCMVFRGLVPGAPPPHDPPVAPELLRYLDEVARGRGEPWLPFSKGGAAPWSRRIPHAALARVVREPVVLAIARERMRSGAVAFHLTYAEGAETLSCDALRKALALPACPARVVRDEDGWTFEGAGEGHGVGLDVERARRLSAAGTSAAEILRDAYAIGVAAR